MEILYATQKGYQSLKRLYKVTNEFKYLWQIFDSLHTFMKLENLLARMLTKLATCMSHRLVND